MREDTKNYLLTLLAFVTGMLVAFVMMASAADAGHQTWCHFDQGEPGEARNSVSKGHGHENHEHDFLIENEEDEARCLGTEPDPEPDDSTTTTTQPTTTTSEPEDSTSTTEETTTTTIQESTTTSTAVSTSTTIADPPAPSELESLPFTGSSSVLGLVFLASALLGGGIALVRRGNA